MSNDEIVIQSLKEDIKVMEELYDMGDRSSLKYLDAAYTMLEYYRAVMEYTPSVEIKPFDVVDPQGYSESS